MEAGMEPENQWKLRSSVWREERSPSSEGIVPVRFNPDIFKAVTLWERTSQVMPVQLQTKLLVSQFLAKKLAGSSVTWPLRARRACWSVVILVVLVDAIMKERIKQWSKRNLIVIQGEGILAMRLEGLVGLW